MDVALDINFDAPEAKSISAMGAWGYPAAPPYNGAIMHKCVEGPYPSRGVRPSALVS